MNIWDGNRRDTTDYSTDKYLQINSCGFQNTSTDITVVRKKGRVDYLILLVNSGICETVHNGTMYTLTAGNLVIYAPGEEQKYSFKADTSSLWCHFTGEIVEELLDSCDISSGVYLLKSGKSIFAAYSDLIQRFHQQGRERFANASLIELIYNISDAAKYSKQKEASDLMLPILTYINANYNKQIKIEELAKKSGYSKSRFSHIFSEATGTTPIKYQNDIRLKVSCEMLASTELSVTDIAYSCGFNDPLYYSRIFKKKYDVSPTQYRLSISNI